MDSTIDTSDESDADINILKAIYDVEMKYLYNELLTTRQKLTFFGFDQSTTQKINDIDAILRNNFESFSKQPPRLFQSSEFLGSLRWLLSSSDSEKHHSEEVGTVFLQSLDVILRSCTKQLSLDINALRPCSCSHKNIVSSENGNVGICSFKDASDTARLIKDILKRVFAENTKISGIYYREIDLILDRFIKYLFMSILKYSNTIHQFQLRSDKVHAQSVDIRNNAVEIICTICSKEESKVLQTIVISSLMKIIDRYMDVVLDGTKFFESVDEDWFCHDLQLDNAEVLFESIYYALNSIERIMDTAENSILVHNDHDFQGPHPVSITSSISNISKTTNPSSKPNLLKVDPDAMEIVTNNTSIELKEKNSQKDASNSSLNVLNTSVGQESEQSASPKIRNRSYSTPVKPNLPQEPTLPSHNRTNTTPIPPKELLSQHRKTLSSISPDQIPNNGSPRVTRHSSASTASFNPVLWMLSSVSPSPTAMTLAEFKRTDYNPRQQRIVFFALQKQMEAQTRGIKKKTGDRKRESSAKRNKPSTLPKWGSFLSKKRKKKTTAGTFHSISMAIHDNRISFVCSLLDDLSQTDLQKKETEARKIFLHAMANGMENVCMVMLERGFPQNVNNSFTHRGDRFVFPSFFLLAVGLGLDNVVRAMIKQKCNVNHSWYDITATHLASCKGNIGILQLLLENGGEVTAKLPLCRYMLLKKLKSQKSKNALKKLGIGNQIIPQNGSEDASGLALSLNDDYVVKRDLLPLDLAAACGNGDVVKYILSKMAQKAISSSYFCLLVQRDLQITMNLVKAGANIEQTDQFNSTPLHLASRTGSLDIVVVLLSKGANINARGQNGWTPIHEALSQRRLPVAQYLCSRGADLNIKTNSNKNAWEMGEEFGLSADELKEYLTSPLDQKIQDRIQLVSNAFTHLQPISTFEENNRAVQNEGYNPQPNMKLRRKATVSGMNLRNSFIEKERFHPNDESDLPPLDLPPMVNVDESFEKYEMKAGNSKWKEKMSALGGLKGIKKALNGNK